MRGDDQNQQALFSYVSPEARVPKNHPLRPIRILVDHALLSISSSLSALYSHTGRPSIAPEQLLRAMVIQILYSIRSERMLVGQLDHLNLNVKIFQSEYLFLGCQQNLAAPTLQAKKYRCDNLQVEITFMPGQHLQHEDPRHYLGRISAPWNHNRG
ncbi:Transposase domain [Desulfuromonas thiophila]|uniref:Transposase domain n=1 Tax=Desulfuromonas thiophila TaxID=57664 RepID=A0A1G7ALR3_9BACT|nr:Transposase domain [Desulfuromonas thiophila]